MCGSRRTHKGNSVCAIGASLIAPLAVGSHCVHAIVHFYLLCCRHLSPCNVCWRLRVASLPLCVAV